ncbi:hypothetical protein L1987_54747 [Smallanthus sonchifolius]|uniref:Uncharacterized protein n=1 Tax=Smallanthus sonchifolius TaxID=185202 RepID=A0ACB9E8F7_9ASTR|nr:hypothetical protein L1987_54747 [Smallanthus sonchifolius]
MKFVVWKLEQFVTVSIPSPLVAYCPVVDQGSSVVSLVSYINRCMFPLGKAKEFYSLLRLARNPICWESGVQEGFCSLPTNTTLPYSTPNNHCVTPSCGTGLVSSPNCRCALPYTGLFFFKAPSFSSLGNPTIYMSLQDSLMTFLQKASLPVDSLSIKNPSRNSDDYLVINLDGFPSGGEPWFNRTGILGIGFALSNPTFMPSKVFNTYIFIAESYANFLSGNVFLYECMLFVGKNKLKALHNRANPLVYKGSLPNGKLIAVQRAEKRSSQGGLEFKTEIELLSRVHHKNVVGLIGFCLNQGEQMLVYEYIMNGTLKDSLAGRSDVRLDWMRRIKVALGAARVKDTINKNKELYGLHEVIDPAIGLSNQLKGLERFVDMALRCVEDTGNKRMSEVVKELESIMELVGLNPCVESSSSTSTSYEGVSKDYNYPHSNDSDFSYSKISLPPILHTI